MGWLLHVENSILYPSPYLTIDDQIALLQSRGMVFDDLDKAKRYLSTIGYYRLSAYWRVSRVYNIATKSLTDKFIDGTTFEEHKNLYVFDRNLKLLVLDAIERIEIALKTSIALRLGSQNSISHLLANQLDGKFTKRGPKRETNTQLFTRFLRLDFERPLNKSRHDIWVDKFKNHTIRAKRSEEFVKHIHKKYPNVELPIWIAIEIWDFGQTSLFLDGMKLADRNAVAQALGFENKGNVIISWVRALNDVRNICAHHGRLWNRTMVNSPGFVPKETFPMMDIVRSNDKSRMKLYLVIIVIRIFLDNISPESNWHIKVRDLVLSTNLVKGVNDIPKMMGFPDGWDATSDWQ